MEFIKPRPTREDTFMQMARLLSQRASCRRKYVGCLIVEDKHIVSSGVNGPRTWVCQELGCDINKPCKYAIHAEINALHFAQVRGISVEGCALYCTTMPCIDCAKEIVVAKIAKVFYTDNYRSKEGIEYLIANGIELIHINE